MLLLVYGGIAILYVGAVLYYFHNLTRSDDILSLPDDWAGAVHACCYINLDEHPERAKYMEERTKALNIPCERVVGVPEDEAAENYPDVMITAAQVGQKMSHIRALSRASHKGWLVVFEDDVELVDNQLLKLLDALPGTAELAHFGCDPWSVLWGVLTFKFQRVAHNVWRTRYPVRCCHAYAITRSGAEEWLQQIETNFYEFPLNKHGYGIQTLYVCHRISDMWDLWKVLTLQDMSYISQNKKRYGYLN